MMLSFDCNMLATVRFETQNTVAIFLMPYDRCCCLNSINFDMEVFYVYSNSTKDICETWTPINLKSVFQRLWKVDDQKFLYNSNQDYYNFEGNAHCIKLLLEKLYKCYFANLAVMVSLIWSCIYDLCQKNKCPCPEYRSVFTCISNGKRSEPSKKYPYSEVSNSEVSLYQQ